MPNLSVKLDEATRERLQKAAACQDITPHAFMVNAIGAELERVEAQNEFMGRALRAREMLISSGQALDGPAFADYLRARVRGKSIPRPALQDIGPSDAES